MSVKYKAGGGGSRNGCSESTRSLPLSSLIARVFILQSQVGDYTESLGTDNVINIEDKPEIQGKKLKI